MRKKLYVNENNPWIGLSSYQESDSNYLFCGRERATKEVVSLVDNNLFLLLYGQTGVGKTSLLNAGVFPNLRCRNYLPLYIRLGQFDEDKCFSGIIVESIQTELEKHSCYIKSQQELHVDDNDYLWKFFSSSLFYNNKDEIIYPVVVLDQFEEIFLKRKDDAWNLITQIYKLLDDTQIIDTSLYHTDTNFRFVVSIREDYLYKLEECIDTLHLTEMLYCRYRLAPMTAEEARSVVLVPGENIIAKTDADFIADKIIDIARNENDGDISCLLLSLACSQLFQIANGVGSQIIRKDHLRFMHPNPLNGLYETAKNKLKRKQLKFIENNLIDKEGKRVSVSVDRFDKVICDKELFEGNNRIFNEITLKNREKANKRVELLHDLLAKSVYEGKMKRNEMALFFKKLVYNGFFYAMALFLDLFLVMYIMLNREIELSHISIIVLGILLIVSTCIVSMGQMYKDIKMEVGILPQISLSLLFYALMNHTNLHAYHSLKPSAIIFILNIFLIVNILLFTVNIIQITIGRKELSSKYSWKELFGIKKGLLNNTTILYSSVILGTIMCFLIFSCIPKTSIELLRERAERKDPNALFEMGEYYMKYYPNLEKAKGYFEEAISLGHERAKTRIQSIHREYSHRHELSESLKMNAVKALVYDAEQKCEILPFAVIDSIYKGNINGKNVGIIRKYNQKCNKTVYMDWLCKFAIHNNREIGNVGYRFWEGEVVEQDMIRAFELYVEGESHDNIIACYLNGWGVEKSFSKAKEYYLSHQKGCSDKWWYLLYQ